MFQVETLWTFTEQTVEGLYSGVYCSGGLYGGYSLGSGAGGHEGGYSADTYTGGYGPCTGEENTDDGSYGGYSGDGFYRN